MTSPIQTDYDRPKPGRDNLPVLSYLEHTERFDGTPCLVLQANIGGQAHEFALTLDELDKAGVSGPAGVEELRRIREAVEKLADALPRQTKEYLQPPDY